MISAELSWASQLSLQIAKLLGLNFAKALRFYFPAIA